MSDFKLRSVTAIHKIDYGKIIIKLDQLLADRHISSYRLQRLTKASYDTIKRYRAADNIQKMDITLLAEICYILDCDLSDILEYIPPKTSDR